MAIKLTSPIELIEPRHIQDAQSFTRIEPRKLADLHAYVEQRHASSAWVNRAQYTKTDALFRIRKPARLYLDERLQIVYVGQTYEIDAIEPVGGYLEILAHKISPEGEIYSGTL